MILIQESEPRILNGSGSIQVYVYLRIPKAGALVTVLIPFQMQGKALVFGNVLRPTVLYQGTKPNLLTS